MNNDDKPAAGAAAYRINMDDDEHPPTPLARRADVILEALEQISAYFALRSCISMDDDEPPPTPPRAPPQPAPPVPTTTWSASAREDGAEARTDAAAAAAVDPAPATTDAIREGIEQLCAYLSRRSRSLVASTSSTEDSAPPGEREPPGERAYATGDAPTTNGCLMCDEDHRLMKCDRFRACTPGERRDVSLFTLPLTCSNPESGATIGVDGLMDNASTSAFISKAAADLLGLKGRPCMTTLTGFNGTGSRQSVVIAQLKIPAPGAATYAITTASHFGGAYERLIGLVKRHLYHALPPDSKRRHHLQQRLA